MPHDYMGWNDALAARIFRPEMSGRPVFLFVNDDLVEEIGDRGAVADFVECVEQGPPWVPPGLGLCQKALRSLDGWRDRGLNFPPYVGYLGLFVLAVGVQGAFPAHAYYARLRTLLGWPDIDAGALPSFDKMLRLWEDIEVWSNRDMGGTLGVFSIRIAGESIHVGLPKAQAVLTEPERLALPSIFAAAHFDVTAPPPDAELVRALRRYGSSMLRPATLALISRHGTEAELLAVLLDAVREELEDWDGALPEGDETRAGSIAAMARVCLRIDEVGARATATLRIAAKAEFPDDGLRLASDGVASLTGQEYQPGWSSPLRDESSGLPADAAAFDWSRNIVFNDLGANWQVRFPAARVRIFVPGLPFDLPDFVEVRSLPRSRSFVLAASAETVSALSAWAESGEVDLRESRSLSGLPPGWKVFKSSGAQSDQAIRAVLPELALPARIRLRLVGGIRSEEGVTFFPFAPPAILVEGGDGTEDVLCNGRSLSPLDDSAQFLLPPDLPHGERIVIEIRAGGETVRRQALFLSAEFEWRRSEPLAVVNRFGISSAAMGDESCAIRGVLGGASDALGFPIRPVVPIERRAFAIGRRPGQVSTLATGVSPEGWPPIWIVELERRGRAVYCGSDIADASPLREPAAAGGRDLWKDILWRRRKVIRPPDHPVLRRLWAEYVEAGRSV